MSEIKKEHMQKLEIQAALRDMKIKPDIIRKTGKIPAVLYGNKIQNTPLVITLGDFEKILRKAGESTLVELKTDDGKSHHVLIHDVQYHFLTSQPMHADFLEVSMTEKLKANIILEFVGESKAVKELGGVLVKLLTEVEVECLPADLPHNLEVDISSLKTFEDSIHVKDIKVPAKVDILTPGDELLVKVQQPRDVEAELAEPATEDVAAVMEASAKPTKEDAEAEEAEEKK